MAETNTLDLTDLNTDEEPSVQAEITDAPDPVEEEPEETEGPEEEEPEETEETEGPEEPEETEGPEESEEPVEVEEVEEPEEPEETEGPEDPVPSVQEVVSNVKEILTSDPVEEPVSEVSFTDKFNILNGVVQRLGFRDPWNSRLSALKTSSDSDTDKLRELIDVLKDWRFKPEYRNKLVTIRDDTDSSVEDRFLQVVKIVERIGLREPFRSQLIALK
tara:strand:- start:2716 stop:3369 length:654 start_codon:yes stop_codon:yes gene_type:complete